MFSILVVLVFLAGVCIVLGLAFYFLLDGMAKYKKRYQERRREQLLLKMKKQRVRHYYYSSTGTKSKLSRKWFLLHPLDTLQESGSFSGLRAPEARVPSSSSLGEGYGGNNKTVYANNKEEKEDVEMGGVAILHKNSEKLPK